MVLFYSGRQTTDVARLPSARATSPSRRVVLFLHGRQTMDSPITAKELLIRSYSERGCAAPDPSITS